jgi:hypothetical protein
MAGVTHRKRRVAVVLDPLQRIEQRGMRPDGNLELVEVLAAIAALVAVHPQSAGLGPIVTGDVDRAHRSNPLHAAAAA